MKWLLGFIISFSCICAQVQDSTYYYKGWGKPGLAPFVGQKLLRNIDHTQVKFVENNAVLIKHYNADRTLHNHLENEYDQYGNHVAQRAFNNKGRLRVETIFRNDPTELTLFRTVFGSTFNPATSNFLIRREYNDYGRETGYFIIGIQGQTLCSRTTTYRDDRRKEKEILRDDLRDTILTERRYKYIDSENRTILEEFNGAGKMVQRVILFDHHDIIQE